MKSEIIGQAVKDYRNKRGLKRRELAEELHVSVDSVEHWEWGICRPPLKILEKLLNERKK